MEQKALTTLLDRMVTLSDSRVIGRCDHDDLDLRGRWPKLNTVARVESKREWRGKIETDVRYVISSLPPEGSSILQLCARPGELKMDCTGAWTSHFVKMQARLVYAMPHKISLSYVVPLLTYFVLILRVKLAYRKNEKSHPGIMSTLLRY